MSSQRLKPGPPVTPDGADGSIVDYELDEQKNDSDLRVMWSEVMDQGPYKNPSTYRNVEVLILCWAENSNDLATNEEVKSLQSVLEKLFNFHVQVEPLDNHIEKKLQVRINSIVAQFVEKHDGPNTLLIVYYAGHGRPGSYYGHLELFGQTSPNDKKKRVDSLVWNKTEELLKDAAADVLEIFDCCYAGFLGATRGEHRLFEYLAATSRGSTPVPGKESFTSALIYALEDLLKKNENGRFTTDELLRKIQHHAPFFPKDQVPVLSDREEGASSSAGRIMLHPLDPNGTPQSPSKEGPSLDPTKRQTLTMHFDFGDKPSLESIKTLGLQLNNIFDRNTLGVNRVRLGSLRSSMFNRAVKSWTASLARSRRMSGRQQQPHMGTLLPVPSSQQQQVSSTQISIAPRDKGIDGLESVVVFAPVSPLSNEDSEDQRSDHRKKRKLSS